MTHDQGVVVRELLLSKIGAICSADSEGFVCKICQISGITQIRLLLRGQFPAATPALISDSSCACRVLMLL